MANFYFNFDFGLIFSRPRSQTLGAKFAHCAKKVRPSGGNCFFRPSEESNGPVTKSFELGGFQIILSDPNVK